MEKENGAPLNLDTSNSVFNRYNVLSKPAVERPTSESDWAYSQRMAPSEPAARQEIKIVDINKRSVQDMGGRGVLKPSEETVKPTNYLENIMNVPGVRNQNNNQPTGSIVPYASAEAKKQAEADATRSKARVTVQTNTHTQAIKAPIDNSLSQQNGTPLNLNPLNSVLSNFGLSGKGR